MADDQNLLVSIVAIMDFSDRGDDPPGHLGQGFTTGWGEIRVVECSADEIMNLCQLSERQSFPVADGIFAKLIDWLGGYTEAGLDFFCRMPAALQRTGIDGRKLMVRSVQIVCGSSGLTSAPPGERAVCRAVPETFAISFDLTVTQ